MRMWTLALARRRLHALTGPEHHRAIEVPIRGKPWCRLVRSLLPLSRLPTIPTLRRIHGLSEIQPPARKISKCRCRRRRPRDNLPMRFLHWRTACVAERDYSLKLPSNQFDGEPIDAAMSAIDR